MIIQMRIALFTDTFPPQVNGVANTVARTARALSGLGHEVRVYTVSPKPEEELRTAAHGAYEVVVLPSVSAVVYPGERAGIPFLRAFPSIQEFAPDIIHAHTPFAVGWTAARAARKLGVPLVGTHHTFFDHYLKHVYLDYDWARSLSWKLTVRYYNHCDVVTSPTRSLANVLTSHGLKPPVELLPNMLDTELFSPKGAPHPQALVYMGRLSYEKSVDDMLAVSARILHENPAASLTVIGDGPERAGLEFQAKELGIAARVHLTGYLYGKELVEELRKAAVFLTASRSENMPLALMEAMAVGLPIAAVRSLGLEEMLRDGENALLSEPGDLEALARNASSLLSDAAMRKSFSATSREMSLRYSESAIAASLAGVYAEAISGYGATRPAMSGPAQ